MHTPKKRFGQHFLTDPSTIERIAKAVGIREGDHVVEIGPGRGCITDLLVASTEQQGARLDLIELDRDLIPMLRERYQEAKHVQIIEADALSFDFSALSQGKPMRLVGNLPYNISSPLIFHLLSYGHLIQDMLFMLQEEVVDRLVSKPGSKRYGRLSVMVQLDCFVAKCFSVLPEHFDPPPKVMSAVVYLKPEMKWEVVDRPLFSALVEQAFVWRRKILKKTLKRFVSEEFLGELDDLAQCRPEQISVENFVRLANMVYNNRK